MYSVVPNEITAAPNWFLFSCLRTCLGNYIRKVRFFQVFLAFKVPMK